MDSWPDVDRWTNDQLLRLLEIAIEQRAIDQQRADAVDDPHFSLDVRTKDFRLPLPASQCGNGVIPIRTEREAES